MFAKLTALVGGGFVFPYSIEEPYSLAWGHWTHYRGKSKEDSSPVSIFKISSADVSEQVLFCARNGVKRLRMLRHPNILTFKDAYETTDKGGAVIYLVTEPVKPLLSTLEELKLTGQPRDDYLAMGLLHMTKAISFLNNDCKLIHGNVCLAAVVATDSLDWKLHAFDLLSEHTLPQDCALRAGCGMVANQYKPGEYGRSEWDAVQQGPPWAVDAWGLGCLMREVFGAAVLTGVDKLRDTSGIPPALLSDYQRLLSSVPARRLNPSKVAESAFLNNRLLDIVSFMESVTVKDTADKESFFRKLPQALPSVPQEVAVRKLLPLLAAALEFGGAPAVAVSSLLWIGARLEDGDFNRRIVPCLSKLFASSDRTLRRALLEQLDAYAPRLTPMAAEESIYPQLQTGFSDSHAYIRELTLKSVLSLAPKLSNKTLVQSVLKHLNKTQTDEEPSIRANTTVLLGCLANTLGEAACRRVLLNAFSRALRDPFPPARAAGLKALVATKTTYSAEDAAVRMLPLVTPLCVDPVPEVRAAALACLETFSTALKEEDERRNRESPLDVNGPATTSKAAGAGGSSVLTWAVSSLIGAPTAAASPAPVLPSQGNQPSQQQSTSTTYATRSVTLPSAGGYGSAAQRPSGPGRPAPVPTSPAAAERDLAPSAGKSKDGWDDDEDILDLDAKEEEEARRRIRNLTTGSTGSRSTSSFADLSNGGGGGGGGFPTTSSSVSPAAAKSSFSASSTAVPAATSGGGGGGGGHVSLKNLSPSSKWDGGDDLLDAELAKAGALNPTAGSTGISRQSSALSGSGPRRPGTLVQSRSGTGEAATKKLGAMRLGVSKLKAADGSTGQLDSLDRDW